jgi:hypothetical protein
MKNNLYTYIVYGLFIGMGATVYSQEPTFGTGNPLNLDSKVVNDTETLENITPSRKRRLEEVGRAARNLVRKENLTHRA